MQNAKITGIASYVPDYVLTNDELSHMVDTNDEWITTRVGIKERRILKGEETGSSDLGVKAVAELLKKTGVKPSEVDLLLFFSHLCYVESRLSFPFYGIDRIGKIGNKNSLWV